VLRKAVKDEAERLIRDYGQDAYQIVSERLSAAHRRRHNRLEEFLAQVAREIERRVSKMPPELKRAGKGASGR
jgi:vacuolar-type H+-ATPase subunit E/Vma4